MERIPREEISSLAAELGALPAFADEGPSAYMAANAITQRLMQDLPDQRDIDGLHELTFGAGWGYNRKPTPQQTVEATLMQMNLYGSLWQGGHALSVYLAKTQELLGKDIPESTRNKISAMITKISTQS